jgi:hypothetical protein
VTEAREMELARTQRRAAEAANRQPAAPAYGSAGVGSAEPRDEAESGAAEKRTEAGAEGEGELAEAGERPTGADWRTICRR